MLEPRLSIEVVNGCQRPESSLAYFNERLENNASKYFGLELDIAGPLEVSKKMHEAVFEN